MLDLAEIACTPATLYQSLDQFAVWQAEAKRERRRLARADMRAIIRRAVATVPDDAAPRIRAL